MIEIAPVMDATQWPPTAYQKSANPVATMFALVCDDEQGL